MKEASMKRSVMALVSVAVMLVAAGAPLARPAHAARTMGSLTLLAPTPGTVVSGDTLAVKIAVKGVRLDCAWAGKANRAGIAHWHLHLDGALVDMFCGTGAVVSMQNVTAGKHTLMAVLASNNHMDMMGKGQMARTSFVYQPAAALPLLKPYQESAKPTISILAPSNGATVGEHFAVVLDWTNFRTSCDLFGKTNLKGYGHWHLNIDTMMGPMMGMGTMLLMGCTHTATVFTQGLRPGRHKLFALLANDQHAPLMPEVATSVTINVKPGAMGAM
jgi:hypothetical protein